MAGKWVRLIAALVLLTGTLLALNAPVAGGFRPGSLLEPWNGLYRTARMADNLGPSEISIPGTISQVRIVRDARGVPHIFAENDRDAVMAMGYAVAQDRLFQIDFISRAALGELASVLGSGAVSTDRFFTGIGMRWAARKTAAQLDRQKNLSYRLISWYQSGVNAYIRQLRKKDYPFEFRVLGYEPSILSTEDAVAVQLYMTYDLSYTSKDLSYERLESILPSSDYQSLFPDYSQYSVPIIPDPARAPLTEQHVGSSAGYRTDHAIDPYADMTKWRSSESSAGSLTEGLIPGKGSNNWAVGSTRSTTGFPILAGDMHLALSLPAIWYEAHIVTPEMNVYGVTIPGAPTIIEGITEQSAWAYTNTGSDQLDLFRLDVSEDGSGYFIDGILEPFEIIVEEIDVARAPRIVDTLRVSRFGPVVEQPGESIAIRWVGHDSSRTLLATWRMGRARSHEEFEDATRFYDSPMQNILYADRSDTIAIRSTGYNPVRSAGSGSTVIDGAVSANAWSGRIPFDELPAQVNPQRGFLTSTNQQPAGEWYPYYLGSDWRDAFRSIRIDRLLQSKERHSVSDIMAYQADVHVVQGDLFIPFLSGIQDLSTVAVDVRDRLEKWDRRASMDQVEPLLFHEFLSELRALAWDEAVFKSIRSPSDTRLYRFLLAYPESDWLDVKSTPVRENADALVRLAMERVATKYGDALAAETDSLLWGHQHKLVIRHLTRSPALRSVWRGPFPYPGYDQTLSPASGMTATSSASWRLVVDFSTSPLSAYGVYPGGQSGNPFSDRYDNFIETFLRFEYYPLVLAGSPDEFDGQSVMHELWINPAPDSDP